MDHVIAEGNQLFFYNPFAETWMIYHDALIKWWEKAAQEHITDWGFYHCQWKATGDTGVIQRQINGRQSWADADWFDVVKLLDWGDWNERCCNGVNVKGRQIINGSGRQPRLRAGLFRILTASQRRLIASLKLRGLMCSSMMGDMGTKGQHRNWWQ